MYWFDSYFIVGTENRVFNMIPSKSNEDSFECNNYSPHFCVDLDDGIFEYDKRYRNDEEQQRNEKTAHILNDAFTKWKNGGMKGPILMTHL